MDAGAPDPAPAGRGTFRLAPFRGIMLAPRRVGDPASARVFARPYAEVPRRLDRWEAQGHLRRDATPAVYLHEYTAGGLTVRGLVGALDVSTPHAEEPDDADRVVLPHEAVEPRQSAELASRMEQMQLNPAPILLVHRGPAAVRAAVHDVVSAPPWAEFTDRAERWNRVWAIREPALLGVLDRHLAGSRALLADGHHRFAAYRQLSRSHPGTAADRGLAMLVDQDDTPLFLGAIHRTLAGTSLAAVAQAVAAVGAPAGFVPATEEQALAALGPSTLVLTDGHDWARLELRVDAGRAAVESLHEDVLPRLALAPGRVGYHHTVEEALSGRPEDAVAVLMPAPDFDTVDRIVSGHRLLPEKATSFQPKPGIGVLMRSLLDG